MANVPSNVPNGSGLTLDKLSKSWDACKGGTGRILWTFAKQVETYKSQNPKVKGQDIAKALGKSPSWVSKVLGAAKAYPKAPETVEQAAAFYDKFHGVDSAKREKSKTPMDAAAALKAAIAFARKAVKLGADAEEVSNAIAEALTETPAESETETQTAVAKAA